MAPLRAAQLVCDCASRKPRRRRNLHRQRLSAGRTHAAKRLRDSGGLFCFASGAPDLPLASVRLLGAQAVPSPGAVVPGWAFAVPGDHRFRLDDDEGGAPNRPSPGELCPQKATRDGRLRLLHGTLEQTELVAQREVRHLEGSSGLEDCRKSGDPLGERADHGTEDLEGDMQTPGCHAFRDSRKAQSSLGAG